MNPKSIEISPRLPADCSSVESVLCEFLHQVPVSKPGDPDTCRLNEVPSSGHPSTIPAGPTTRPGILLYSGGKVKARCVECERLYALVNPDSRVRICPPCVERIRESFRPVNRRRRTA